MKQFVSIIVGLCFSICLAQTKISLRHRDLILEGEKISTFTQGIVRYTYYLEINKDSLIYYELSSMKDSTEDKYLSCKKYSASIGNIDLMGNHPKIKKDEIGFFSDNPTVYTIFLQNITIVNWWDITDYELKYQKMTSIILKFTDVIRAKEMLKRLKKFKSSK